jgi:hypothetical protein
MARLSEQARSRVAAPSNHPTDAGIRDRDRTPENLLMRAPVLWRYQRDHLLAKIPGWQEIDFPAIYAEAKTKLQEVIDLDVGHEWTNQAHALAQKAKILHDDDVFKLAKRIQLQAYRRCGEIIDRIPPAHGANQNIVEGTLKKVTRTSAALDAGLSVHQRNTALRLVTIDKAAFNAAVEGDPPPTVTQLAYTVESAFFSHVLKKKIPTREFREPLDGNVSRIEWFARWCRWHRPNYWAGTANVDCVRRQIHEIRDWLDRYESALPAIDLVEIPPRPP